MIITGGNPTINSNGLKMKMLPVFNFIPGDIIAKINGKKLDDFRTGRIGKITLEKA